MSQNALSIFKNRNALIGMVFAIFVLLVGSIAYYRYTHSPKYALLQAMEAVEKHDVVTFQKYVDLDSVINSFVNQLLVYEQGKKKEKTGWDYLGMALAKGLLSSMQPYITNEIKQAVIAYIKTGKEDTLFDSKGEAEVLGEVLNKVKTAEGKLDGVDYVRKEGKIAHVGMKIHFDRYDVPLILELMTENIGDNWKITELTNLAEFLRNLDDLEKKKIAELNKPIIEEMKKYFTLVDWEKRKYEGWVSKSVFILHFKNNGKEEVDKCNLKITIKDSKGKVLFQGIVESDINVVPGKTGEIAFQRAVGFFDSAGYQLFNTPQSELKIEVKPQYMKFTNGKELKLYKMWQKV